MPEKWLTFIILNSTTMVLGIDVGGTSVKFGLVSNGGNISHTQNFDTREWVQNQGFIISLLHTIKDYIKDHPDTEGVGIGFPGLLSLDRQSIIYLPNVKNVENIPIVRLLQDELADIPVRIENDAKCAALGELYFGEGKNRDSFILLTLGTGIGCGMVIQKQLFLGGRGNAMEIGHILTKNGTELEHEIGLNGIIKYAESLSGNPLGISISPKKLFESAQQGDLNSKEVFRHVGQLLGEALVAIIRLSDIDYIILAGGIAGAFEFISPSLYDVLKQKLPPYYTKELIIKPSGLPNAGILGAAELIYRKFSGYDIQPVVLN